MARATAAGLVKRLGVTGPAAKWAGAAPVTAAAGWANCPRADWLITLAMRLGVDRKVVVRAAARAVELALPAVRHTPVARRAWDVALRWTTGQATAVECVAARTVATHAAGEQWEARPRAVMHALADLAEACDGAATFEEWVAAGHAAEAARRVTASIDPRLVAAAADRVREEIPWASVAPLVNRVMRAPIRSGVRDVDSVVDEVTPVHRRRG